MSIEEKVINIISEVIGVDAKSEDTFEDVDSLDLVEIVIECEKEFSYHR